MDMAFGLLKYRFREADSDHDDKITKGQFKSLLQKLTPNQRVTDELVQKIFQSLEDFHEGMDLTFKQYLYGMYLFVKA